MTFNYNLTYKSSFWANKPGYYRMAKRPQSEEDLNEPQPIQGEGAVALEKEADPVPVTVGSLPSKGEDPQLGSVAVDDVAAEDEMYTHPFWASLLNAGYTPL